MNSILLYLTKFQIGLIGGKYARTEKVKLPDGKDQEIVIFSGAKPLFSGQCTPLRKIIIHEPVLNNERRFNYIFQHEMANKRQWWSYLFIPLYFGIVILIIWGQVLVLKNDNQLKFLPLEMIILAILMYAVFSWVLELDADMQTIKIIGLYEFLHIVNNPQQSLKNDFSSKIIVGITHPPTNITIRCWKWLHRNDANNL